MEEKSSPNLEKALARTESDALNSLKAGQVVLSALKKYVNAVRLGNLRDMPAVLNDLEKAELVLRQQIATTRSGWDFDADSFLGSGAFIKEILATAEQKGVRIFERDDLLYSYPVLIRILASEQSVRIDKKKNKLLRPSVLVNNLRELQKRPPRFRPESFLESLYGAYTKAVLLKGKGLPLGGTVIPLLEIYELFTLLPRDYVKQEFARDIYLLDRSGVATTRKGARVSFPASTGTKTLSRTLSVINERGEEKLYFGICFSGEVQS